MPNRLHPGLRARRDQGLSDYIALFEASTFNDDRVLEPADRGAGLVHVLELVSVEPLARIAARNGYSRG